MVDLSDTPAGIIARLDASLLKHGETITLRRSATTVSVRARLMPVRPEQLIGDIDQTYVNVIMSPTEVSAASWLLPVKKGDQIVEVSGKVRNVEFPKHIRVNDTLVRIELLVGG